MNKKNKANEQFEKIVQDLNLETSTDNNIKPTVRVVDFANNERRQLARKKHQEKLDELYKSAIESTKKSLK